jgi:hypothetical protein
VPSPPTSTVSSSPLLFVGKFFTCTNSSHTTRCFELADQ